MGFRALLLFYSILLTVGVCLAIAVTNVNEMNHCGNENKLLLFLEHLHRITYVILHFTVVKRYGKIRYWCNPAKF